MEPSKEETSVEAVVIDMDIETRPGTLHDTDVIDPDVMRQHHATIFSSHRLESGSRPLQQLAGTGSTQMTIEVLHHGHTSGPFGIDHPDDDQVFYVLSGIGKLILDDGEIELHEGSAGIVLAGAPHQFVGKGEGAFRMLSTYSRVRSQF